MCQAVRDGGRRCSVHQHNTIAAVSAVTHANKYLTKYQIERMFTELRRESPSELTAEQIESFNQVKAQYTDNMLLPEEVKTKVENQFNLSDQHEQEALTDSSKYAVLNLRQRAEEMNNKIESALQEVAARTGYTVEEVRTKYVEEMDNIDTSRGSAIPAEYTRSAKNKFHTEGLPSDRATVTALIRMSSWNPGEQLEGTRVQLHEKGESSRIAAIGAHEGRLEVVFRRSNGSNFTRAYRNVPEMLSNRLIEEDEPMTLFLTEVAHNDDYKYASEKAANADTVAYRCLNCGQFRSLTGHNCPRHGEREQLLNLSPNLTTDEVNALMKAEWIDSSASIDNPELTPVETTPPSNTFQNVEALPLQHTSAFKARETSSFTFDNPKFVSLETAIASPQTSIPDTTKHALGLTNVGTKALQIQAPGRTWLRFSMPNSMRIEPEEDKQAMANFFREAQEAGKKGAVLLGRDEDQKIRVLAMYITEDFYLTFDTPGKHDDRNLKTAYLNAITHTFDSDYHGTEVSSEQFKNSWTEAGATKIDSGETSSSNTVLSERVNSKLIKQPKWNEINNALQNGETVLTTFEIQSGTSSRSIRGGTIYGAIEVSHSLEADTVFNRSATGELQVIARNIKCSCEAYQQRYYCEHVSQAEYDIHTILNTNINPIEGDEGQKLTTLLSNKESIRYSHELDSYVLQASSNRDNLYVAPSEEQINHAESIVQNVLTESPEELTREQLEYINYALGRDTLPIEGRAYRDIHNRSLTMPNASEMVDSVPVRFPLRFDYMAADSRFRETSIVTGHATLQRGESDEVSVTSKTLKCSCNEYKENYDCEHVRDVTEKRLASLTVEEPERTSVSSEEQSELLNKYNEQLTLDQQIRNRLGSGLTDEEYLAEKERIAEEVRREIRRAEEAQERLRIYNEGFIEYHNQRSEVWSNADAPMSDDMPAFHADMSDLVRRRERGETILEMQYENVTNGICADTPGARGFGIEIEFTNGDLETIGRELYEAGLTESPYQQEYGASRGDWSRWSFEEDCTVSAEIVSPIMKDTPEYWRELEQVIEIVNRNGGKASTRAGSHVHISSGSYGTSRAKHAELIRLTRENEDTLFRLASNPGRGTHRGTNWCNPNIRTSRTNIDINSTSSTEGTYAHHGDMVNTGGSSSGASSHIEFRMWDASLNAAVIQQQVALSAAFVDLAEREAISNGGYVAANRPPLQPKGTAFAREANTTPNEMTEAQFHDSYVGYARLFDRLFPTAEQRNQASRLLAMTKNQR